MPAQVDFYTMLSGLGDTIAAQRKDNARKQALAIATTPGPDGTVDFQRAILGLANAGDLQGAQLFATIRNRQEDQARQARQDAFQREESARAQRNADRSYALQERASRRADDRTPAGFERDPASGGYRPIAGGPADPVYLARKAGVSDAPTGFERDPGTGGLRPIAGGPADPAYLRQKGDRQNAPSGYVWNDPSDPSKGLTAIPGGPGEKMDAEVAGRLGLARSFLGQLPEIKRRVAEGGITGPIDAGQAYFGMGGPGEIRRQMDSGAEALLRMLTGAGMNKEEAAQYVRRYQFSPTDKASTVLSKLNQLERELNSVGETVGKGRGGWTPPRPSGQSNGADAMLQHARDAIAQGAPRAAVIQRLQQAGIDPSGL